MNYYLGLVLILAKPTIYPILKSLSPNNCIFFPCQAASRSSIIKRVSYEEMVHHKPSLPSLSGGGFRETLIMLTQWVIILQVRKIAPDCAFFD